MSIILQSSNNFSAALDTRHKKPLSKEEIQLYRTSVDKAGKPSSVNISIQDDLAYLDYLYNRQHLVLPQLHAYIIYEISRNYIAGLSGLKARDRQDILIKRIGLTLDQRKAATTMAELDDRTIQDLQFYMDDDTDVNAFLKDLYNNQRKLQSLSLEQLKKLTGLTNKNHAIEILVKAVKSFLDKIDRENQIAKETLEGVTQCTNGKWLAYVDNFPVGMFATKARATLAYNVAVQYIDDNTERCHGDPINKEVFIDKLIEIPNPIKKILKSLTRSNMELSTASLSYELEKR